MKKMVLAAVLCMAFAAVFTGCSQDEADVEFSQLDTPSVTAAVVNWGILLNWKVVDHATRYNVYRKEAGADDSTKILRCYGYDPTDSDGWIWYDNVCKTCITRAADGTPAFHEWAYKDDDGNYAENSIQDGKSYVYFVEAVNGSMYSGYGTTEALTAVVGDTAVENEDTIKKQYGAD